MEFNKFIKLFVVVIVLLMWFTLFWFILNYGNEVKKDPCSVCAEKMKGDIICSMRGAVRIYYKNGSIEDIVYNNRAVRQLDINWSEVDKIIPQE